uniref:Uncharacterized protein n=1 Tax=Alexandrium monilatum TaxID=311494 RepID=A0A7S4RX24_9DINO|mmetsp:Transcript_97552/g.300706  ORF Transcript_97552/g.300706 Transcript_97552/m.300706 type:complete len:342 (+) Transcript_97552:71-1096(+)
MEAASRPCAASGRRRRAAGRAAALALYCSAACLVWSATRPAFFGGPASWLQHPATQPQHPAARPGGRWCQRQGSAAALAGSSPASADEAQGRRPRRISSAGARRALRVNEEEYIEVWDQTIQELSLDVRELLITDANLYFIGPDTESYLDSIREVAGLLNYTWIPFDYQDIVDASECVDTLEKVYTVAPLISSQRWPWSMFLQGLVIWIDPDGYEHLNVFERDRIRKLKFPKKKAAFGPAKAPLLSLSTPSEEPLGDPLDMWMEADVHVDLQKHKDLPATKVMLASIINAILDNPPKWRGWMKQAKIRGSVSPDFQTPFEERRRFHSHGVSPRLNRLLKER